MLVSYFSRLVKISVFNSKKRYLIIYKNFTKMWTTLKIPRNILLPIFSLNLNMSQNKLNLESPEQGLQDDNNFQEFYIFFNISKMT